MPADVGLGLAGLARQGLDEHGHHDIGPSLADQGKRAIEVEQNVADFRAGHQGNGQLDAGPLGMGFQKERLLGKYWRTNVRLKA